MKLLPLGQLNCSLHLNGIQLLAPSSAFSGEVNSADHLFDDFSVYGVCVCVCVCVYT